VSDRDAHLASQGGYTPDRAYRPDRGDRRPGGGARGEGRSPADGGGWTSVDLATFKRSPKEGEARAEVRVQLATPPTGTPILQMRRWASARPTGDLAPTREGATFRRDELRALVEALQRAEVLLGDASDAGQARATPPPGTGAPPWRGGDTRHEDVPGQGRLGLGVNEGGGGS
jgi:hypothetical protein